MKYGFKPVGGPALLELPAVGAARHVKPARADAAGGGDRVHQEVAVLGHAGLHDRTRHPLMNPEDLAVGGRDADRARSAQQHDLIDAVERHAMRRAVAAAVRRTLPAQVAAGLVVGRERARRRDHDQVVDDERRAREAPEREAPGSVSVATLRDHSSLPLAASSALRIPVAPCA